MATAQAATLEKPKAKSEQHAPGSLDDAADAIFMEMEIAKQNAAKETFARTGRASQDIDPYAPQSRTLGQEALQIGKEAAIPTALGAAGFALGGVPGEIAGAGLGVGVNQLTGITEPGYTEYAANMVLPPLLVGGARLAKMAIRNSHEGQIFRAGETVDELMRLPSKIKNAMYIDPATQAPYDAGALFDRVAANEQSAKLLTGGIGFRLNRTKALETAQAALDKQETLRRAGGDVDEQVVSAAKTFLANKSSLHEDLQSYDLMRKKYHAGSSALKSDKGSYDWRDYNRDMEAAFYKDYDSTVENNYRRMSKTKLNEFGMQNLALLKHAMEAHRVGRTVEELKEVLDGMVHHPFGGHKELKSSVGDTLADHLTKNRWIKMLPQQDQDELKVAADFIIKNAVKLPSGKSGVNPVKIAAEAAAGGLAAYGATRSLTGAMIGGASAVAMGESLPHILSWALASKTGRRLLVNVMAGRNGTLDEQGLGMLGTFMAASMANPSEFLQ